MQINKSFFTMRREIPHGFTTFYAKQGSTHNYVI